MKTLLLADDDAELLESLSLLFQIEGFHVLSAADGRTALAHARDRMPDMIVTDFNMPLMDGGVLARELRAMPGMHAVPVVMMSSDVEQPEVTIDGYLRKPVDFPRVLELVESMTGS